MNPWNESVLVKSVVERGISQWATMAGDLERDCPKLTAEVLRCLEAAPWGAHAEGKAFQASHLGDGGPKNMVDRCEKLVKDIAELGDGMRASVDNTLGAHSANAQDWAGMGRTFEA
jgi:hypothetical protein